MTTKRHAGIQFNALVLPSSISISSSKVKAYQEEGFSLDIPAAKRKQLNETFLRVCGVSKKKHIKEKRILWGK